METANAESATKFPAKTDFPAFKLGKAAPDSRGAAKPNRQADPKGYFTDGYAEGTTIHWLIDTGCTNTMLSVKKYHEIPEDRRPELYEYNRVIVTADDTPLNVHGQTKFNIKFGSHWVRHSILEADISNEGLIGIDFLTQHKASIDFAEQKISFHGEDLQAQCYSTQDRACRIHVNEGVMIPAGTRKSYRPKRVIPSHRSMVS